MDFRIRIAEKKDAASIAELGRVTFIEAYAAKNSAGNMKIYLDENFRPQKTADEFDEPCSVFFIAETENEFAGYAKLRCSEQPAELEGMRNIELARIYVLEKFHGHGVGKSLLAAAITHAQREQCEVLWLGVWKQNEKAIEFYKRNGFNIFGEHIFQFGDDPQVDWMMKLML